MVDSVNNSSINSLIRAQQVSPAQNIQSAARTTQINQTRAGAVVPVKASATTQTLKVASANSNLPRGSIVDKLV